MRLSSLILSFATPVHEERAFGDLRRLTRRGKRLLVISGAVALAFFFSVVVVSYGPARDQAIILVIGDYIATLGIAVPGLTLWLLRMYTDKSIRRGNPKVFSSWAKLALVSVSWIVLLIVVVLLISQNSI